MPKYRYNVINPENKSLSGTINAPDEQSARLELNQLGFSIISINEIPEETAAEGAAEGAPQITFEFAAIDKNQKRVVGTIQAEDRYGAYFRLVKEYLFEVEYLVDTALPEDQKTGEKQKGVFELQNQMDEAELAMKKKEQGATLDIKEFEKKQQVLQTQVEFVLKKVKSMLDLYEPEIKPEVKQKIRVMVDKILRIKNSTNLDYIRKSCEELLTFLQQEELFLHEDAKLKEKTQMILEAKSMMMQLHRSKNQSGGGTRASLLKWREDHILNNENTGFGERLINFFISFIIGFGEETAEIKEIRNNITVVNQQLKQYLVLYYQSPSPEFKTEAKSSLKGSGRKEKNCSDSLKQPKRLCATR